MTVKELFNKNGIVLGMLEERASGNSYRETAYFFVNGVYNDSVGNLSVKQRNWMNKILEDMVEWKLNRLHNPNQDDSGYHDIRK